MFGTLESVLSIFRVTFFFSLKAAEKVRRTCNHSIVEDIIRFDLARFYQNRFSFPPFTRGTAVFNVRSRTDQF